jgi:hypothetical protein
MAGSSAGEARDSARLAVRSADMPPRTAFRLYCSPRALSDHRGGRLSGCRCSENFCGRRVTGVRGRGMVTMGPRIAHGSFAARPISFLLNVG